MGIGEESEADTTCTCKFPVSILFRFIYKPRKLLLLSYDEKDKIVPKKKIENRITK